MAHVRGSQRPQGPASPDRRFDRAVKVGGDDSTFFRFWSGGARFRIEKGGKTREGREEYRKNARLLCNFGRARLSGRNEARANPHSTSAEHQACSNPAAVINTAGSNELHRLSSHGRGIVLDDVCTGRDKHTRRGLSRMPASLAALCANDIRTGLARFMRMLRVADHVHVQDAVGVELVDDGLRRDAHRGDKELGSTLDDDVDQVVQCTFGIIQL